MESIWKQELNVTDNQTVSLPVGAKVLCIQEQLGNPCIWFITPSIDNPKKEDRTFSIIGTGHPQEFIHGQYIGTFQLRNGTLVFHVFEEH